MGWSLPSFPGSSHERSALGGPPISSGGRASGRARGLSCFRPPPGAQGRLPCTMHAEHCKMLTRMAQKAGCVPHAKSGRRHAKMAPGIFGQGDVLSMLACQNAMQNLEKETDGAAPCRERDPFPGGPKRTSSNTEDNPESITAT
jgi:hypothetical protein